MSVGAGTAAGRGGALAVLAVAAIGGAGTMTVELSAVRLLAPWFGASLAVWTNVIGVVLLGLALGYAIGGRLSAAGRPLRRLGAALLLGAAYTALVPSLAGPVAGAFVPSGLTLQEAGEVVVWGSLAASLALFLPPATLLGAVSPLGVQALQERGGGSAGLAGGGILCASTLGSLVGVFGTSHAFLPRFGLEGTYLLAAVALAGAGAVALLSAGRGARGPAVALLFVGAALGAARWLPGRVPELGPGTREIAAGESPYQTVRVVERIEGQERLRFLQVNEAFDSFQSVWQPEEGLLPEGYYYNAFALPLFWDPPRDLQGGWRVLLLGLGAGTAARVLQGVVPAGRPAPIMTGIELDPLVVRLAREHLDLERAPEGDLERDEGPAGVRVFAGLDARVALLALQEEQDLVILDCYANQVEIPFHLATVEFFGEIAARLSPGGYLLANVGGLGPDDPVVSAVARTTAAAFGAEVLCLPVPGARNVVVVARRGAALPLDAQGLLVLPEGEAPELARLFAPLRLPGGVRVVEPPEWPSAGADAADVLTDEGSAIEKLQLRSLLAAGRSEGA